MGRDVILGSLSSRIVRPGDVEQGLHGDIGQSMITADRSRPVMMNTVWMLQDTGKFNGGTRVRTNGANGTMLVWFSQIKPCHCRPYSKPTSQSSTGVRQPLAPPGGRAPNPDCHRSTGCPWEPQVWLSRSARVLGWQAPAGRPAVRPSRLCAGLQRAHVACWRREHIGCASVLHFRA